MTRATTMSPFRLFGRTARDGRPLDDGPDPWLDDPPAAAEFVGRVPAGR